jgi:hypothetical protein
MSGGPRKLRFWEAFFCMLSLLGAVVIAGAIGGVATPVKPHSHPVAIDNAQAENPDLAQEDLVAQQEMANWAFGAMIGGFLTMIGSFTALFFVYGTLRATRETLQEAQLRNAIEMRAYIMVSPMGLETWIGEPEFIGQIEIRNLGKTLARNVSSQVRMKSSVFEEGDFKTGDYKNLADRSLPPGGRMWQGSKNRLKLDEFRADWPNFIYVYGAIHYTDYLGERRFTKFCHRYNKSALQVKIDEVDLPKESIVLIGPEKARHQLQGNDAD